MQLEVDAAAAATASSLYIVLLNKDALVQGCYISLKCNIHIGKK